jgi:hypothetical protein
MYQLCLGEYRYQINGPTFRLLEFLREGHTLAEIQQLAVSNKLHVSIAELENVLSLLASKNNVVVIEEGESGAAINDTQNDSPKKLRNGSFLIYRRLFTPESIFPVMQRLQWLFARPALWASACFTILSHSYFLWLYLYRPQAASQQMSAGGWGLLLVTVYLGILFHEFGHASACVRYGVRHGDIGIGIYVMYPVFYSNVTECWSLSRRQRAVVDISGLYFQMIFSSVACVLFAVTHADFFRYVVLSMVGSAILNLNPFFRFDGYWLLTDLTGFVSLHRSAFEFWKFIYCRLFRKPQAGRRPDFLDRRLAIRAVFLLYAVASAAFLGYFVFQMGHAYLPYAFRTYSKGLPELIASAKNLSFNLAFWQLLFRIAMVSLSCWGLFRLVIDLGRKAVSGYKANAAGGGQVSHQHEFEPTGGA